MKKFIMSLVNKIMSLFKSKKEEKTQEDYKAEISEIKSTVKEVNYGKEMLPVEEKEDVYLYQGDIMIPKQDSRYKAALKTSQLWKDNTVIFEIDPTLENQERVINAINHWDKKTNIKFRTRTTETDYVYFTLGSGCSSYIGRIGGRQEVRVGSNCSTGNVIHEIGHAIGFWHEHARSDRDNYVNIHWDNIASGREHNFRTFNEPSMNATPQLDFGSIMMYGSYSFTSNGQPTITKKDGATYRVQRSGLSNGDIEGVNKVYIEDRDFKYDNGNMYFKSGANVLRHRDRWYFSTRYGWKSVYLKDNGYWYYL